MLLRMRLPQSNKLVEWYDENVHNFDDWPSSRERQISFRLSEKTN